MFGTMVVIILAVLAASCTRSVDPEKVLDEAFEPKYVQLSGTVVEVEIADAREDTTSRALEVPSMSFPWNDDEIQPTLTPDHRSVIESEVRKYFAGGEELVVKVVILRAVKRFKANWRSEGEEVECELSVEIERKRGAPANRGFVGGAVIKLQSLDASSSKIDDLYLQVIAASIEECLTGYANREEGAAR